MTDTEMEQTPSAAEGAGDSLGSTESGMNGDILNHIDQNKQNGFPESSGENGSKASPSKHKEHRDKDKDRSSSKHSSSPDKHKSSSSSSSSKHRSSSSSSKHHSSSSSSKHGHSSSNSSHKSGSSSSKHRDGHSSSSSSKDKDRKSSSHSSSSRDKDKDRHSSSDKHKSSSSSSKHSSSSSDKHRDKDRDKKHSSSSGSSSSKPTSEKKENLDVDKEKERRERKEKERQERKERERKERKEKERQERKERERLEKEAAEKAEESAEDVSVKEEPASPSPAVKAEPESDDDDDVPLGVRMKQEKEEKPPMKREREESDDDEDDTPLSARVEQVKKVKQEKIKSPPSGKKRKAEVYDDDESEDEKPLKKKKKAKAAVKTETKPTTTPTKKKGKGNQETQEVWKWWEEDRADSDDKWKFLEHKGPVFAPDYERMPSHVKFYYDGKAMTLSDECEEVATFYAKMLEHEYTTKEVFNKNFFKDWRKQMTPKEREIITDLKKCNFREMCEHFKEESEKRKNRSKEEKLALKEENARMQEEYGFCIMDNHKEKIGNFRIEPPGLFRGRGDHPKQGMLKRRVMPEDVIINCSKDSKVPDPPKGHKWKRVQHDTKVTWLASWNENIQGQIKYVMLNASSRLKGEKDWQKYETARRLHKCVDKIRANYQEDWKSKEMRVRQRAVAMYFIDKLALRAGNEKDEGETADTVGCCSIRVEHITLHTEKDGKQNVVEFDFLGKDSIRYQNSVPVEKRVFKNLQMFTENKQPGDDLFDRLNTTILNKHLHDLMEGLTAKVFRTYNASRTLQEQLDLMTNEEDPVPAKMLSYNRANRAVAILCNHQRAAPKNFSKQMENIMAKIKDKRGMVKEAKKQLKEAKAAFKSEKTQKNKMIYEKKKKAYERNEEQLTKLEVQATDKDENKEIALGTSKLNYLDPRISVAWCKKWEVPIEKVYNKTQRDKFRWAIDMADADYRF